MERQSLVLAQAWPCLLLHRGADRGRPTPSREDPFSQSLHLQDNMKFGPADTLFGYLWTVTKRVKDSKHIPDVSLFHNRSYFVVRNNIMEHFGI